MTRDTKIFSSFTQKKRVFIFYGDNNKGGLIFDRIISKNLNPTIDNILIVKVLNYDVFNISQLC